MLEAQKFIPKSSRLLGMLHDPNFRPTIAPNSSPVNRGRVLFEQGGQAIDFATSVRAPICLLSEADTELLRTIGNPEEGVKILNEIIENSPTAAVLLDAHRNIQSKPTIVWFAEDEFFSQTVARAIGVSPESLLPKFQHQADVTLELLANIVGNMNKGIKVKVRRHAFSDRQVMEAIVESIHFETSRLGFLSRDRKKLKESSAAIVGITHALFPLILSLLSNRNELAVVQGPVHLETDPPGWLSNPALSTVRNFVNQAAANSRLNHRSLLPCLFKGEPIGEFSAIGNDSPQLGRKQRGKLETWLQKPPFPLNTNAIFGHAIGLADDKNIDRLINDILNAEQQGDVETGKRTTSDLAEKLDTHLKVNSFWK